MLHDINEFTLNVSFLLKCNERETFKLIY